MRVPAAGTDQRLAIFGAVDYASGDLCWTTADRKDGTGFVAFLAHIAATWPADQLVLVLDNVSYHRSAAMRTWWTRQQGRVIFFWLPVYAPQLNLQERVWRFLKQKLACHRYWADKDGLRQAAETLLTHTTAHFHADPPPSLQVTHDFCQSA